MGIRMSSNQFMYNYNLSLQNAYKRQTKLFEDADGGSLHRPSDNSVDYSKLLRYKDNLSENEQYQKNVKDGLSWMHTSDSAMTHMYDIMKTFVSKTVAAANDSNNESDWNAIAKEMEAEIQEIVSVANTQQGERFLFSGQRDLIQPFNWEKNADGAVAVASRGLAKTLDNSQVNFFKGNTEVKNIDTNAVLTQMLTLQHDGKTYYLDTQNGYVYDKEFVDDGYKEVFNTGITTTYATTYAVGRFYPSSLSDSGDDSDSTLTEDSYKVTVADYFTNQGILKKVSASTTDDSGDDSGDDDTETDSDSNLVDATIQILFNDDTSATTVNFATIQQQIVNYAGNMEYFSMVKLNGVVQTESDTVNVNGKDLFGTDIFDNEESGNEASGCAMINQMLTVLAKTEAHDNHWLTSDGVTISNVSGSTVLVTQTHIGARSQLYESVSSMLETQNDIITENITNVSSTDVAKLAVDLMQAQTLYNMSLSMGGRILPLSLADYL